MASRKTDYPCLRCKEHVAKNTESVQCSLCEHWVHKKCEKMSDETFKVLCNAVKEGLGMYWACTACTSYSTKFNKSIMELGRRVTKVEEMMKEKEADMDNMKREVEAIKATVNSVNRKVESGLDNQNASVFKELRDRENRKNNVVFHNLPEPQGRTKEERIQEDNNLVEEVCGLIDVPIKMQAAARFTVRLGKFTKDGCRPVLVGYKDTTVKDKVLDNARALNRLDDGSQWKKVTIVPDLTKLQRKEEDDLRKEASDMNDKMSDEESKNFTWKVVGRRGERRLVRASRQQEERTEDRSHRQDARRGTRSASRAGT